MSDHRDREAFQLVADNHVKAVLEFMQANVSPEKLIGVAETLPKMARLLWQHIPQESCIPLILVPLKTGEPNQSQSVAIESSLDPACERDGSVEEAVSH